MRDVRLDHAGEGKSGMDVLASLRRISAQEAKCLQRDFELHGEDGIRSTAERESDGAAQVVELGLELAHPSGLLRTVESDARLFGHHQVMIAVPYRVGEVLAIPLL